MKTPVAVLGIVLGVVGLSIDLAAIVPALTTVSAANPVALSLPEALLDFWTYFTHLTNLGLLLTYVAALSGWPGLGWLRRPRTQALMAAYILLVMLYYHFMLAPYFHFEGAMLVATIILHYLAPLCYLGWWAACLRHGALRFADIPLMLLPGLLYVAWALGRGAVTGKYPYDILDAATHGYLTVAIGVGTLLVAVVVFSILVVVVDRLLARRAAPA